MPVSKISPAMVFAAGMTAGTLFAMAAAIVLGRMGIDLFAVWRTLFPSTQAQLRSAVAWWAIGGAGFIGGFAVSFVMSRFAWLYLRSLRSLLLAATILAMAALARLAPSAEGIVSAAYVAANAAAIALAAAMAAVGAFFALRR